jgi:hypothetical protein
MVRSLRSGKDSGFLILHSFQIAFPCCVLGSEFDVYQFLGSCLSFDLQEFSEAFWHFVYLGIEPDQAFAFAHFGF